MPIEAMKDEHKRLLHDFECWLRVCRSGGMPDDESDRALDNMKVFLRMREADAVIEAERLAGHNI